jgi:4-hydroxythreonine-4-phosphate dehydrogenase
MTTRGMIVGITPGCPMGIGPEVMVGALSRIPSPMTIRFFGARQLLLRAATTMHVNAVPTGGGVRIGAHDVQVVDELDWVTSGGKPAALVLQRDALLSACQAAARGEVDALVTGPVRKQALVMDGVSYPGQTEVVHRFIGDGDAPFMVFAGGPFVMGLHTVHMPLRMVSDAITATTIHRSVMALHAATTAIVGVAHPRLVVLGVNPHAGEGGLFGDEDDAVIAPVLIQLRKAGIDVKGPVPADGFFADLARARSRHESVPVDGVLAMYHDQALAPYKLLVAGEGINCTWGLRLPRTSPDHGTADLLAGTGQADPGSMMAAIQLAVRLASA